MTLGQLAVNHFHVLSYFLQLPRHHGLVLAESRGAGGTRRFCTGQAQTLLVLWHSFQM